VRQNATAAKEWTPTKSSRKMIIMLRRIMNEYELATDSALRDAAVRYGARVHAKVRIADVVDIRELTGTVRSYALRAHFDFIVADADGNPLFAVEFDGPSHDRDPEVIRRDALKDRICDQEGFALLRIDDGYLRQVSRPWCK
jgi:very-short-patch-repair endonuclease